MQGEKPEKPSEQRGRGERRRRPANPERERSMPSKDLTPILQGWDYESGTINVRKIIGLDGRAKLQMRLDLGLLQMEITGRPDGTRPHGCESLLEYYERRLRDHRKKNGTDLGFHLTPTQCQGLREEALMYYHRYLSLFVLGEFPGVARDTARNLRLLDFCGKFASDESDRLVLEQYRPYIIMMNTRARASIKFEAEKFDDAATIIKKGLRDIKAFFTRFGQREAYKYSSEVRILRQFRKEIERKLPADPARTMRRLERQLQDAIKDERYEEAAKLRDEMLRMKPEGPQA